MAAGVGSLSMKVELLLRYASKTVLRCYQLWLAADNAARTVFQILRMQLCGLTKD
jgi:hypothetical protein